MINLSSEFEVSTFIYLEDTKGNAKRKNLGLLALVRPLGVTQGHQQDNHSIERIGVPI